MDKETRGRDDTRVFFGLYTVLVQTYGVSHEFCERAAKNVTSVPVQTHSLRFMNLYLEIIFHTLEIPLQELCRLQLFKTNENQEHTSAKNLPFIT